MQGDVQLLEFALIGSKPPVGLVSFHPLNPDRVKNPSSVACSWTLKQCYSMIYLAKTISSDAGGCGDVTFASHSRLKLRQTGIKWLVNG